MAQQQFLADAVRAFDDLGIPYMLTGSHASSIHGQPRSTHDIDVVVDLSAGTLPGLLDTFPEPDFYVSREAAREALARRTMFNILDLRSSDKLDLWLLTDDAFDLARFNRRQFQHVFGQRVAISTPEDTIIMKLRWASHAGTSERQLSDAKSIVALNADTLDLAYIQQWIATLGLENLWNQVRS